MRDRLLTLAALFVFTTGNAFAAAPSALLRQQRLRIDGAISARNALLDRIHFVGGNDDSVQLASISASELTVEYALQALEGVFAMIDHRTGKQAGLKSVGEPMSMLCQLLDSTENDGGVRMEQAPDIKVDEVLAPQQPAVPSGKEKDDPFGLARAADSFRHGFVDSTRIREQEKTVREANGHQQKMLELEHAKANVSV